jgi:hypothetical protein
VEKWNSANKDLFYGKAELSVVAVMMDMWRAPTLLGSVGARPGCVRRQAAWPALWGCGRDADELGEESFDLLLQRRPREVGLVDAHRHGAVDGRPQVV